MFTVSQHTEGKILGPLVDIELHNIFAQMSYSLKMTITCICFWSQFHD